MQQLLVLLLCVLPRTCPHASASMLFDCVHASFAKGVCVIIKLLQAVRRLLPGVDVYRRVCVYGWAGARCSDRATRVVCVCNATAACVSVMGVAILLARVHSIDSLIGLGDWGFASCCFLGTCDMGYTSTFVDLTHGSFNNKPLTNVTKK